MDPSKPYYLVLKVVNSVRLRESFILIFSASLLLITLVYGQETLRFLEDLMLGVGCTVFAALTGLAVKFTVSKLGDRKLSEQVDVLDEFTGRLLVGRSLSRTFAQLFLWNVLVSFAVAAAGFITFGTFPIIWVFLHFGVFSPKSEVFESCLHPWFETAAVILSASLGVWGGLRLSLFIGKLGMIPLAVVGLILGLHAFSALLETLEIIRTKED